MRKLQWSLLAQRWIGEKDGITISVAEETYEKRLRTYLATKGIEPKTWTQYMQQAEEAWKKQREAENAFQANLDDWLACTDPGVWTSRPRDRQKTIVN